MQELLFLLNYTHQSYDCAEGNMHPLMDERLVTAQDGNMNAIFLGWGVMLASSALVHFICSAVGVDRYKAPC